MTFYIAIIDYEMGNLKSIYKVLNYLSVKALISSDSKVILNADGVILPGVGAFGAAINNLNEKKLIPIINQIINEKRPFLGICLGLQLLFTESYEMGQFYGLNLIKGKVISFERSNVEKVPQIGWNNVEFQNEDHFLVENIPNNSYFYFVHSYYAIPESRESILGITEYGSTKFASIVCKDNIVATQFHPEKSGKYGLRLVQNFIEFCKK